MNKYFEAVKKGGDYWANHMPEKWTKAHARNRALPNPTMADSLIMEMAEKLPQYRRHIQMSGLGF